MKKIKFRAWMDNEMLSHENLIDMDQETNAIYTIITDEEIEEGTVFMQYTGLKDKNGVEIFDKDIVEIKGHAFHGSVDIDGKYEVGYNERMELCCGNLILFRQLPYITVIGNIYENPELLEENK